MIVILLIQQSECKYYVNNVLYYSPFELIDLNNAFNNSKVAIIDPITKHNVAKMSFGILEVKNAFEQGHFYLNRYFNIPKQDGLPSSILKGLFTILKR